MSMKSHLALLTIAMLANQQRSFSHNPMYDLPSEPKNPIIPKGCKEYWFDINGCYPNLAGRDDVVFKCVAANEKSAIRKFNKWKSKSN